MGARSDCSVHSANRTALKDFVNFATQALPGARNSPDIQTWINYFSKVKTNI